MDIKSLLKKHGLPTHGSEAVLKERAMRFNLLVWDIPNIKENDDGE